ncbi:MAG: CorA family divalent cation transporter [Patescibacteria group bacterium]
MIQTYKYNHLTWVDIQSPTSDDIATILRDYKLHPLVAEEILSPSSKAKIERYDEYLYAVLHFPVRVRSSEENSFTVEEKEIDFIIGKSYVISVTYSTVEPLQNFAKVFEVNSIVDKAGTRDINRHAGFIFYYMLKRLYGSVNNDLQAIEKSLYVGEKKIFLGEERYMVRFLSEINRELIDIKHGLRGHRDVLSYFSQMHLFGDDFGYYSTDLQTEYQKAHEFTVSNRDLLSELRDTNDSLLTTKQNETMKVFTIMAFVTFPLTLIIDILTVPSDHNPIMGLRFDFEIILGIMILATLAMFWYFKHKKWL